MPEQTWGDEAFTDGATSYGTCPGVYIALEPWSTSPLAPGGAGFSLSVADGHLNDALQKTGPIPRSAGFAAATLRLTVGGGEAAWFAERQNIISEGTVRFAPGLAPLAAASPGGDTLKQFGICSHVSGGTLTTPGGAIEDEYHSDVTGWFLIETKQEGGRARVVLLELSSGSATVLANETVASSDPAQFGSAPSTYFFPQPLRMTIVASGGNREITCFRTTQAGPEAALFGGQTFVRTALADGRCGFGVQTVRVDNGGLESSGFVNEFTIQDASGAYLFVDQFRRIQRLAAREFDFQDAGNVVARGHSLESAWVGDAQSGSRGSGIAPEKTLVRNTATANQAACGNNVSGTTDDWPGVMLRQTPASTPTAQRVAATIERLAQDTSTRTETGVVVRFSLPPVAIGSQAVDPQGRFAFDQERSGWGKEGYAVYVVHDTSASPVWQLDIRHFEASTDPTYRGVRLATADLTSLGLSVGTPFELDVEVRSFDGDTFGVGGFVAIGVEIDSTAVTPVPEDGLSGIVESDDLLIDTRSSATQEGAVGLYHNPDALGAGDLVAFLDFSERALTDPPIIDPAEQASVAVTSEDAGKSGELAVALNGEITETSNTRPIRHRFESGKVQTIGTQAQARRRWDVTATLEATDWAALVALLETNGSAVPFDWTHPYTGEAVVVRFTEDTLDLSAEVLLGATTVYDVSFTMEEVFAASTFNPGA